MESTENKLKEQLQHSSMPYPDFDQMFESIQKGELRDKKNKAAVLRKRRQKTAAAISIAVALAAAPVYAAISYDWTDVLSTRAGIQTALEQGLGQSIEKSVTKNGITLTVHTAFTDENRTVLLYSLDPGDRGSQNIYYESIGLLDSQGKTIEGHYVQQWNEELGQYQGYFESDWVMDAQNADISFELKNIRFTEDASYSVALDPAKSEGQTFSVEKDGIDSIRIESFQQSEDKTMLKSSISLTDPSDKDWSWYRLEVLNAKGETIEVAEPSVFGTPGLNEEYTTQQIFATADLNEEASEFRLAYDREAEHIEGDWNLGLSLSKKQMESGTVKEKLAIPIDEIPGGSQITEMIVTPTQIRVVLQHEEKYTRIPYLNYHLEVGGKLLEGYDAYQENKYKSELRFELTPDIPLSSIGTSPITLIADHRIDEHKGSQEPVLISGISEEKQCFTQDYEGYPVTWTYYLKDNNLYIESESSDTKNFGGINQTYYGQGKDLVYGVPSIIEFAGNGKNKSMDVYENFEGASELEIYAFMYRTEKPEDELRVLLTDGK
ncbi:DUF4179 domain-containing protein [Neobacillus mesonae]|nr:DUF4179 domain-containing protein [Neobacillus mesonae]